MSNDVLISNALQLHDFSYARLYLTASSLGVLQQALANPKHSNGIPTVPGGLSMRQHSCYVIVSIPLPNTAFRNQNIYI